MHDKTEYVAMYDEWKHNLMLSVKVMGTVLTASLNPRPGVSWDVVFGCYQDRDWHAACSRYLSEFVLAGRGPRLLGRSAKGLLDYVVTVMLRVPYYVNVFRVSSPQVELFILSSHKHLE